MMQNQGDRFRRRWATSWQSLHSGAVEHLTDARFAGPSKCTWSNEKVGNTTPTKEATTYSLYTDMPFN
jgi:hypothetical protein